MRKTQTYMYMCMNVHFKHAVSMYSAHISYGCTDTLYLYTHKQYVQ